MMMMMMMMMMMVMMLLLVVVVVVVVVASFSIEDNPNVCTETCHVFHSSQITFEKLRTWNIP